jgi:hypothetical protein
MPRREAAERKARERFELQPALDCEACGALTPAARFRYFGDRLICDACEHHNAQSRVRSVPRELLAPSTICINVIPRDEITIQAMHIDRRTMLGPQIRVQRAETLRRLLVYLGATPAELAEFDNCHRRWGQSTVQITLAPGRKNLLRLER